MEKNQVDPSNIDFIWNKNRLYLEKESLKLNMLAVLKKKPEEKKKADKLWIFCIINYKHIKLRNESLSQTQIHGSFIAIKSIKKSIK